MENERYSFSPITKRPPLHGPADARVAVWIVPNIEHYRFDDPHERNVPDVPAYSQKDYGNRVGVWRLMDVLDKYHLRATVALNSDVTRYEPEIIRAGNERGWEWMGHGLTNSQSLVGLDPDAERHLIREALRTIEEATGTRPKGWLGPGRQETMDTPDILADEGVSYVVDWAADDEPIDLRVKRGRLLALPYSGITDRSAFESFKWTGEQFCQWICDQFDVLYAEGEHRLKFLSIALHPFLTGRPFRAMWLDRALAHIAEHDRVWYATGGEIARWYTESVARD